MNVKVHELMSNRVVTTTPSRSVGHLRKLIGRRRIGVVPVVDPEGHPLGVVSTMDLVSAPKEGTPVSAIMTEKVYTVPQYDDVSVAARVMRNHRIHHLLVTHERKLVGVLSAFDLLELVESRRFVAKNAPTRTRRRGARRA